MKILITGAGGAAAISIWKSLNQVHELFMADIDPCAAGLYLVPPERRLIIPGGDSDEFITTLLSICQKKQINLLIPTVDVELVPIAKQAANFTQAGIGLALSSVSALEYCRDKYQLLCYCQDMGVTPTFTLLNAETITQLHDFPYFAKPRLGAGSRGAITINGYQDLANLPQDNSYLIQALLPGEEYSVDVYISNNGYPLAAVPRLRMKIDSGVAVACQTKIMPHLSQMAIDIAQKVGIRYVANIQFKADNHGDFKLLEINPRFPGTLPLTAAAGIDIPKLLIDDIEGKPMASSILPFKELMVVRYWTEAFFAIDEWQALNRSI